MILCCILLKKAICSLFLRRFSKPTRMSWKGDMFENIIYCFIHFVYRLRDDHKFWTLTKVFVSGILHFFPAKINSEFLRKETKLHANSAPPTDFFRFLFFMAKFFLFFLSWFETKFLEVKSP